MLADRPDGELYVASFTFGIVGFFKSGRINTVDLLNYSVIPAPAANVNAPVHTIAGQLRDGQTVVHDFTGENAIRWPAVLAELSVEQQAALADTVGPILINMKAGLL